MDNKTDWLAMIYGWSAQIVLVMFGLIVIAFVGIASGALTIGKYASGGALLYWLFN